MNPKELLTDFFEARGRFDLGDRYLGMGGSEVPNLFAESLGELGADDQDRIAGALVELALGKTAENVKYQRESVQLLMHLCMAGFAGLFGGWLGAIENEVAQEENLSLWANAEDQPADGQAFRLDWHYPLSLLCVLWILGSRVAEETYGFLVVHAKSEELKESLSRSRDLMIANRQAFLGEAL